LLAVPVLLSPAPAAAAARAGLYNKLASLDPANAPSVRQAFNARPAIAACKYALL
jgi:hypothetical protein